MLGARSQTRLVRLFAIAQTYDTTDENVRKNINHNGNKKIPAQAESLINALHEI